MPTITVTHTIETDANGYFQHRDKINPPGWWDREVDLKAKLLAPANTTAIGTLDIDAEDGSPSNEESGFRIHQGEEVSLGTWHVDSGRNIVVIRGRTEPIRPNTPVSVKITATT